MTRSYATLVGWGHYVPDDVVTNDDLAARIDTSDEWIRSRSGIGQRHFASPDQATSDLCVEASQRALDRAGLSASDLDLILIATSSPDELTPPVSSRVQDRLGADCGAMTLMVGCTGFVYALVTADQFIQTGAFKTVLVVGAEIISKNLDMEDRSTCVLFGDGAGAVVLQATDEPCGVRAFELGSDGSGAEAIICPVPGSRKRITHETIDDREIYLRMNGREVFRFATRVMGASLQRTLAKAGVDKESIDLFIPHQANARIIEYAVEQFELPWEKVVMNVERYGNTSAATIPIALSEALDAKRGVPGDTIAFVGFGAGLTWASCLFDLGPMSVAKETVRADAAQAPVAGDGGIVEGLIA